MKNLKISFKSKMCLVVLFCMAFGTIASAQNLTGPTNVEPNSTHTYVYNDGTWWLEDLWQVTNGAVITSGNSGSTFTAVIQWGAVGSGSVSFSNRNGVLGTLAVTVSPPQTAGLSNENYIYNITPRIATGDVTTLSNAEKIESVTYFDGLGRPMQQVGIRAGGNSEDIITHIDYDGFGRQSKEYLPYSDPNYIASYRTNALNATNSHYDAAKYNDDFSGMTTADINPYSEKEFENSPLNRLMEQGAPGKDWKLGNGHVIEMDYQTNETNEVRYYYVTLSKQVSNSVVTYAPVLQIASYYGPNELYKTVTTDENHNGTSTKNNTTEEFKNKQGQVVLKRTYNNGAHDTYYVYDDHGNLTYVLPPKAEPHANKPDATELSELCYQYKYDDRNRLVEKKIPGKGWEYIIYNKLDQPIMTQDANLDAQNRWLFTKYDIFGRVAYTGVMVSGSNRNTLQHGANTTSTQWVTKQSNHTWLVGGTLVYYHNDSSVYPNFGLDKIYTINYYDSYVFDKDGGNTETAYGVTPITNVKGLATGSKVRVLGTNDWITSVTYYDDKSRPIYVYSKNNYLDTTDKVKSQLTFDGRATETMTTHSKLTIPVTNVTIYDKYFYDDANRLTDHRQQINNAALDEVIATNHYDDLGQLERKNVGGKQNANRLQNVDYDYNVRGWLKEINNMASLGSDLFAFKINYNTKDYGGTELYNGNIAETAWKTQSDNNLRWYRYGYDALNRITSGTASNNNYSLAVVDYDKNGNITDLTRRGHTNSSATAFGDMDKLVYTYETKSNRLKKVLDNGNDNYGFKDGSNITTEYTYDSNGNMLRDYNKGISSNITYNHLNLPTQVNLSGGNIQYIYDATGVKLKKIVSTGTTTEYAGNFIYENGAMKMFSHPEGYVEPPGQFVKGATHKYVYQYKDHLGNIRLTYTKDQNTGLLDIIEENNYYPFGLKHKGYNSNVSANVNSVASKFKYNGKEFNDELGYSVYDFQARHYDPAIGRWLQIDPLAELMTRHSTYNYAFDNPVFFIDPDGNMPQAGGGCPDGDCGDGPSAASPTPDTRSMGERFIDGAKSTWNYFFGKNDFKPSNASTSEKLATVAGAVLPDKLALVALDGMSEVLPEGMMEVTVNYDGDFVKEAAGESLMFLGPVLSMEGQIATLETKVSNAGNRVVSASRNSARTATKKTGGRLGNEATRRQNATIASELESRGYEITGGGGRMAEEYLKPIGGGRRGGSYPDITATRNGRTLRVNTVDTRANGTMTTREAANAARIRAQKPNDHLLTIPKSQ
ncbi:DUF6443 domain-containing protein [Winogradskyella flava]|uniref:RHS repeat-associated core domain-containing protein n=1 Tax=Winogradskyella flava TaxID=1884876 RepID=A0A842IS29_9FLAO|nr:DUF6443 domain-containing protein [Winogradskyella flava]MBC2844626.1 RHS repeat-associated core domain-containing protein [Winogradskyella flava]